MIVLPDMAKDLTFQEEGHIYRYGNIEIPSTTQILKPLYDFTGINPTVLQNAAERGTEVHYAVEKYLKYGYESKLDGEAQQYFQQFLKFVKDEEINSENVASEIMFHNKKYNYSGTVDMLIKKGEEIYSLWDIKTCAEENIKNWKVQLSGYEMGLRSNGINILDRNVLQLGKDSYTKYEKLKNEEGVFLACLSIYNYARR